jgi:hypothetical protein
MRQPSDLVTARLLSKAEEHARTYERWVESRPKEIRIILDADTYADDDHEVETVARINDFGELVLGKDLIRVTVSDMRRCSKRDELIKLDRKAALALAQFITEMYS